MRTTTKDDDSSTTTTNEIPSLDRKNRPFHSSHELVPEIGRSTLHVSTASLLARVGFSFWLARCSSLKHDDDYSRRPIRLWFISGPQHDVSGDNEEEQQQ